MLNELILNELCLFLYTIQSAMVDSPAKDSLQRNIGNLRDWLTLERIPRVGPLTIARLIDAFGSPEDALRTSAEEICKRTGLGNKLANSIVGYNPPEKDIVKDIETLDRLNASVIVRWDKDYPDNLRDIYDPPALLFMRGSMIPKDSKAVAIVGTRNPGRYGIEITESLTRDLVQEGVTIVSGLARGIDTACHKAAIEAGGRTIGVLGCGIDVAYPKENISLVEEISHSGAVVTEFRPGVPPMATNFYRRNRIISGLSKGVVVVEAGKKSGSLITAQHALDQNRDVFAVPGNVMHMRSKGPHQLIKQGAGLVESAEDIVQALFGFFETNFQTSLINEACTEAELSETAQKVLESVDPDPIHIDELAISLDMEVGLLAGILLELELKGLVRQHPGKMFATMMK